MGVSVGQILRQHAVRAPNRVAVREGGRAIGYGALDESARRVASALRTLGVAPGDRVLLCAGNGADFVAAWFGAIYAGAVAVPAPILSASAELADRMQRARCAVALGDAERLPLLDQAGLRPVCIAELVACGGAVEHPALVEPGSDALILFTSGTTGRAKGARISHASLLLHTAGLVHHTLRLHEEDRVFGALPLTHSFGLRLALLAPLFAGASVALAQRFDPRASWALLHDEAITWAPVVPTMLAAWLRLPPARKPQWLRWVLSAGAPLPELLARRAEERLGAHVCQGYGLTEATFSTVDAPPERRVHGSVGRPAWGVEVRVGEGGEIEVRGHNAFSGYLDDDEATRAATRDGWVRTGDIGRIDGDGRLWVVDRKKDLVIRGGYNVYPAEVEAVLCRHPGVAEVAVVGRPDSYYGEEVVAVVVPRRGASLADLGAFAAGQIARTGRPRELVVVEALPVGPSGKVLKRVLRERIAAGELVPVPLDAGTGLSA